MHVFVHMYIIHKAAAPECSELAWLARPRSPSCSITCRPNKRASEKEKLFQFSEVKQDS